MENATLTWMMTGGTPISGNHHIMDVGSLDWFRRLFRRFREESPACFLGKTLEKNRGLAWIKSWESKIERYWKLPNPLGRHSMGSLESNTSSSSAPQVSPLLQSNLAIENSKDDVIIWYHVDFQLPGLKAYRNIILATADRAVVPDTFMLKVSSKSGQVMPISGVDDLAACESEWSERMHARVSSSLLCPRWTFSWKNN